LYSYAPGNKRVWRGTWSAGSQTADEVTFWSVAGQKLATYSITMTPYIAVPTTQPTMTLTQTGTNYYFGGKLIKNAGGYVYADRLGSIGKYYPYGQERPSATANGKEKFATYFRDSETGLDYADQRYHSPGTGRLMTVDSLGGAKPGEPGSWNRYSYVGGDPINRVDPTGLYWADPWIIAGGGPPLGGTWDPWGGMIYIDFGAIITAGIEAGLAAAGCDAATIAAFQSTGSVPSNANCSGSSFDPEPAQQDPPLTCEFTGATTDSPGFRNIKGKGNTFDMPIHFNFRATGGNGTYTWSNTQTYTQTGYTSYSDGRIDPFTNPPLTGSESLDFERTGSTARLFDAPGLPARASTGGTVVLAHINWSFTLRVTVSSGGQTVDCPVVNWSATLDWTTEGRRRRVTGQASVP
jgi:RHS repeat-associated protein